MDEGQTGTDIGDVNEASRSEFGSGIVVCLAKFSEHLSNPQYLEIRDLVWWNNLDEEEQGKEREVAARHPHGDTAIRLAKIGIGRGWSFEKTLDQAIRMWMNGASDHFYDLDRDKAPPSLLELAALTLRIGHGFSDDVWTENTVTTIFRLWGQACLEVDRMLGVYPDWGTW